MTTVYIIRHAEAEGNLYRIVQGHFDSYVTARGRRQIDALAERFRDVHLDALYSSDLRRTVATAGAITRYHELELHRDARLREIDLGVCEGMSFGDMHHADPQQMYYFNYDPERWRAEKAENFVECADRMINTVSEIASRHDGQTIAIVSHGMAIRSLLTRILGVRSEDIRKLPHGDNTAVTMLHFNNGVFSVEYYNDNSHLTGDLSTFARQTWWRQGTDGRDRDNLRYESIDPEKQSDIYLDCYRDAWLSVHGDLEYFSPMLYLSSAKAHYKRDKMSIQGVYCEDELVGMLEMDTEKGADEGYGWISLVYLKESERGKGNGVQPLGKAITHYERLGRTAVRLHVSSLNEHAIGFYEHCGFKRIGTDHGAGAPLYLMEKRFE